MRPIWQLLLDLKLAAPGELDCEECYILLTYLADLAGDGVEESVLKTAVKQHIRVCPRCSSHFRMRLKAEETQINNLAG
jgi:Zn finger protein HypA/HybF involved in hydrogenase expression